jgi:3,4-dihydroxy-2-butanone 4-phosphate synthase
MTPELRRILSLAGAALVLLAAITAFAITLAGWTGVQDETRTAIAEQAIPPAADPARYLSPGESHAVAGSNLQTRLNEAAREAGLTTGRVNIAPVDTNDPLAVLVEFQAEGEMADLARLLHSIETSLPALIIEDVQLTPVRRSDRLQMTATVRARREPGGRS